MRGRHWIGVLGLVITAGGAGQAGAAPRLDARAPEAEMSCVALMLPSVTGAEGDATAMATAVRDLLVSYLRGPSLRTVMLDARLPSMAVEEAREKPCDHVLALKVLYKRRGDGRMGRALGEAAQTTAWHMPVGSTAGAVTRGAAATGGQAIVALSQSTKAKDELRVEYTILRTDAEPGTTVPLMVDAAKAKSDGEDVLTPIVERAAQAVVGIVLSR